MSVRIALLAAVVLLAGCGGQAAPAASAPDAESNYLAVVEASVLGEHRPDREQLLQIGRTACAAMGPGNSAEVHAAVQASPGVGDAAAADAIAVAAERNLCPDKDYSPVGSVTAAAPGAAPAPAATPAAEPAQVFEGRGADVIDLARPVQFGILVFDCSKCSRNVIVESDAEYDSGLINEIGSYVGKRWLNPRGGTTSRIQVQATGPWKATVGSIELARVASGTEPVEGDGDDVVVMRSAPDTVRFTHSGTSNFVVQVISETGRSGPDLAINEIGKYDGTVLFKVRGGEAALMQVTADGRWTMTPR